MSSMVNAILVFVRGVPGMLYLARNSVEKMGSRRACKSTSGILWCCGVLAFSEVRRSLRLPFWLPPSMPRLYFCLASPSRGFQHTPQKLSPTAPWVNPPLLSHDFIYLVFLELLYLIKNVFLWPCHRIPGKSLMIFPSCYAWNISSDWSGENVVTHDTMNHWWIDLCHARRRMGGLDFRAISWSWSLCWRVYLFLEYHNVGIILARWRAMYLSAMTQSDCASSVAPSHSEWSEEQVSSLLHRCSECTWTKEMFDGW